MPTNPYPFSLATTRSSRKEKKRRRSSSARGWARRLAFTCTPACALAALALLLGGGMGAPAAVAAPVAQETPPAIAVAVDAGVENSCAVTSSGGVKCWGNNVFAPVDVPLGNGVRAAAVASGLGHTCAVIGDGGVKCWGLNSSGQLGDGSLDSSSTPVNVAGFGPDDDEAQAVAIAAGYSFTCALTIEGGVKCWGSNRSGQLGDGTGDNRTTPVNVVGLGSGVQAISAADHHACALAGGGVKCWGSNTSGQLGDGTQDNRLTPVDVSGLSSGVQAIAAGGGTNSGGGFTCAALIGGTVECWGDWGGGSLAPEPVEGVTDVQALAAGRNHVCGLTPAGGVRCLTDYVEGLESGVQAIAAGWYHTCALTTNGGVKCWGDGTLGQLGRGVPNTSPTPVDVSGLGSGVQAATAGDGHTCALTTGGGVKCWGDNSFGQLGDGSGVSGFAPVDVSGLGSGVQVLAAGGNHTCALTTGGGVKCWGDNGDGQMGDGTQFNRFTPVDVTGLGSGVQAIAAGSSHTCALTTGGGVKCWGDNGDGQLGNDAGAVSFTPVDVAGLTSGVLAIAAGDRHTCARTGSGVKCWGDNGDGQLGNSTTEDSFTPVDVAGLGTGVQVVTAGGDVAGDSGNIPYGHTCAITAGGGAKCWGSNSSGQLGDGTNISRTTPVDVYGLASAVLDIAAGGLHTCAVAGDTSVKCWGDNWYGQLGDGTQLGSALAVTASGGAPASAVRTVMAAGAIQVTGAQAVTAGDGHTCILTAADGVECWGSNSSGQLGVDPASLPNSPVNSRTPAYVIGLEGGYSISGRVTLGGAGLAGVTVSAGGQSATTAADGGYTIAAVPAGEQTVTPGLEDYIFEPASRQVTLDADITGMDFTAQAATHSISGRVTLGSAGLAGVTVSAGGQSATTDAGGDYTIGAVPAGEQTVTPGLEDYIFEPASRQVTLDADITGVDFTAVIEGAGRVFLPEVHR